jgi:hypothetical protein
MTQVERWQYFFGLRKISQGSAADVGGVKVSPKDWDFCEEGLIIVDGRVCVRSGTIDIEALKIDATSSPGYLSSSHLLLFCATNVLKHEP